MLTPLRAATLAYDNIAGDTDIAFTLAIRDTLPLRYTQYAAAIGHATTLMPRCYGLY